MKQYPQSVQVRKMKRLSFPPNTYTDGSVYLEIISEEIK